jgi:hypothetical protein
MAVSPRWAKKEKRMTNDMQNQKKKPFLFMLDEEELKRMKKRHTQTPMEKVARNVPPGSSPMEVPLPWQE